MSVTLNRIDWAIKQVVARSDLIERAHLELGIPLEDCISSTVRLAMKQLEANPAQLELFWEQRKDGQKE
jgi:hypothetical protein